MISASGAYSTTFSPPDLRVRVEQVPQPRRRASSFSSSITGASCVRVAGRSHLLGEHGLGGVDVLGHEGGQPLGELAAPLARLEVHARQSGG
jgi:hypothetical protein